jgi:hypothetical protein
MVPCHVTSRCCLFLLCVFAVGLATASSVSRQVYRLVEAAGYDDAMAIFQSQPASLARGRTAAVQSATFRAYSVLLLGTTGACACMYACACACACACVYVARLCVCVCVCVCGCNLHGRTVIIIHLCVCEARVVWFFSGVGRGARAVPYLQRLYRMDPQPQHALLLAEAIRVWTRHIFQMQCSLMMDLFADCGSLASSCFRIFVCTYARMHVCT